jgi:Winged helix DNA-binding domain
VRAQQLDRDALELNDAAILDIGVQDTGPDGAGWALSNRGVDVSDLSGRELVKVWTIRGAPHVYRREDLPSVAAAVEPFSDADAGKRIFDAAKPLKGAGISNLEALDAVAAAMRSMVTRPMGKCEVSTQLTALMDPPYLRFCRPCNTIWYVTQVRRNCLVPMTMPSRTRRVLVVCP